LTTFDLSFAQRNFVKFLNPPNFIPTSASFSVNTVYSSSSDGLVVVDILDRFNYTWYGKGGTPIQKGTGAK